MTVTRNNKIKIAPQDITLSKTRTARATNMKSLRDAQGHMNRIFDDNRAIAAPARPLHEIRTIGYENASNMDKSDARTAAALQNPNIGHGEPAAGYAVSDFDKNTTMVDDYNKNAVVEKYQSFGNRV